MYCGEAGDSDSDYKPLDNDIQSYGEEEEGEGEGEEGESDELGMGVCEYF